MIELLIYLIGVLIIAVIVGVIILQNIKPTDLNKPIDISKIFPIQTIQDDIIVNGNGDLTIGYKIFQPEVFILSQSEAEVIHTSFTGLFKMLPSGTIFHKQDFYFADIYHRPKEQNSNWVQSENLEHYEGRGILKNYSNIYLTFKNAKTIKRGANTSLQNRNNYPYKQPFKKIKERLKEIENIIQGFENSLNAISGFHAIRLQTNELAGAIYDYTNGSFNSPASPSEVKGKILNPIEIDKSGNLKIGNKYIAVLSLIEESAVLLPHEKPKTAPGAVYGKNIQYSNKIESKTSMVFPLGCGLPINHILNTTIEIIDRDKMMGYLTSEKKNLSFISNFYAPAKHKQSLIQQFEDTITTKGYQTSLTTVNVVLMEENQEELKQMVSHTESAFINMNQAVCQVENYDTCNLFFAGIPGNENSNYRSFINTTEQATCYINKESLYMSDSTGLIFNDRFGNPVVLEMWDNKNTVNRNKLIFGPSGSGKSYFINGLVNQSLPKGNHVMIIDIGHSYKRNCTINGGKYYDSADRKSLSFNIFSCKRDGKGRYIYKDTEDLEAQDDKIIFIYTILSSIIKGNEKITKIEKELIKKSIEGFYEYSNENELEANIIGYNNYIETFNNTLDPDHQKLLKVKDIKILLEPYVTGQYKDLLNGTNEIDIENDNFLVFDMEAVQNNEDIFSLLSIIIIELVIQKISHLKGIKKSLIIDEALNFLKDPKFSDFIAYLYRTFRKKEGEIYIAAQNVEFLSSATEEVRNSIVINSATTIMLDHSEHGASYKNIQKWLSYTDHDIELLDSLSKGEGYREFLIKLGKKSTIMRMEVSEFADAVYTSKEVEVKEIERLFKEKENLVSAINQYIENKKK